MANWQTGKLAKSAVNRNRNRSQALSLKISSIDDDKIQTNKKEQTKMATKMAKMATDMAKRHGQMVLDASYEPAASAPDCNNNNATTTTLNRNRSRGSTFATRRCLVCVGADVGVGVSV